MIVGGESGLGARPMNESWVVSIREQCDAAKVPFFFKQWGGVRKSETGRHLEGRTFDAMPARPSRKVPPNRARLAFIEEVMAWVVDNDKVDDPMREDDRRSARQPLLY